MHVWGDEDFDWKALDEASDYIWKRSRQFARFGVHLKEKYGTLRVSTTCAYWGDWPIYQLFHPGYIWYKWPKWFYKIDLTLAKFVRWTRFDRIVAWYQTEVFKYFWKRAAKKWPHIATEILDEWEWTFPKPEEK